MYIWKKNQVKRFALLLFAIVVSCSPKVYSNKPSENGIYADGVLVCPIHSAFYGGSIADPNLGRALRFNSYSDMLQDRPAPGGQGAVFSCQGFVPKGENWDSSGSQMRLISFEIEKTGHVFIPLENGKPIKDKCGNVKSVVVNTVELGPKHSEIDIIVKMKKGPAIQIIYNGPSPFDKYY